MNPIIGNNQAAHLVDLSATLDAVFDWASGQLDGSVPGYSTDLMGSDLTRLVSQSARRIGWLPSSGPERLDIALIDGAEPGASPEGATQPAAASRLHLFFAFSGLLDSQSDELLAGYSQMFKREMVAATCVQASEGAAVVLAVITSSRVAPSAEAWWGFADALNAFGSFKLSDMSRKLHSASAGLKHAAVLADEMVNEISVLTAERTRDRHSLWRIAHNLRQEIVEHRIRKTERAAITPREGYFRSTAGRLLKTAGMIQASTHGDTSVLQSLAVSAVRTRCALLIAEDHTFGGLEQWVCDFARHLRIKNFVPYLIVLGSPSLNSRIAQQFPGEVVYLDGQAAQLGEMVARGRFESLVVSHAYDGLHTIGPGCRVVEVLHNIYFWQLEDRSLARERARVDEYIAVSSEVAEYACLYQNLERSKVVTVPHGLNVVDLYRPPADYMRAVRQQRDVFKILFVGNLYPQKNVICLLEAFARLRKDAPNAQLRVAGALAESANASRVEETIRRLGLSGSVVLLGSLKRRELSREYAHSHMFVLPSLFEGYGLVNLEAAHFGLPLVLSNTGCAAELSARTQACRVASIAIAHERLNHKEVSERSHTPAEQDVAALHTELSYVMRNYPELMEAGLKMVEEPPFSTLQQAGEAMLDVVAHTA
ncbi:glycosyltransferase family 4 protein [Stenotrophomonas maltophilia]|uniref:glycosyltransferase family 4 protein n=1 Tax=Stenotrophomonas geniculata TaxID=86188 RepID=UPI00130FA41B|nr:glycosyltransferase family 4 protein [Stenotrophomonas geniculata]MBH1461695.1 glycosyltransferase family 4 protein [Stenotrophomonas maltophilia]MBH1840327.1 glycosyltransferase family 4 protein [Stenotrophomonas maltophilia]